MALNNSILNHYPWLVTAYQTLAEPLRQNRAHHALLINYIKGSGENALINEFATRLLCLTPNENQPCGHCHSCQLFIAENHPDYYVIEPEKGKLSIGVDQIRKITAKVYERAQQGGAKVIWVKTASLMTEAASNALLKTLEEPPENTFFILSDQHNGQLLPTIRSRCSYYFLAIPELESSIDWLKSALSTDIAQSYNDNQLATALLLNENAPLEAQLLLTPEKWDNRQQFCNALFHQLKQNDYWSLRNDFLKSDDPITCLDWFCSLLSDALKARQKSGRFIINRDQVPTVRLLAGLGDNKICQLYQLWLEVRAKLVSISGLNQELIVCDLLAQSEIIANSKIN